MTHLRLVESERRSDELVDGPFGVELSPADRLPSGRHGIPADLVAGHQRRRLVGATAEALVQHGYARITAKHISDLAGVSISTLYKHFDNVWVCLLAAYEEAGERLGAEIEAACTEEDGRPARLAAGIEAGLVFLAAEPALAQLLGRRPPLEAVAIATARRDLVDRLAAMLRRARDPRDETIRPAGLEERLIDAALSFVSARIAAGASNGNLTSLGPELTELLAGPRRAA